MSCQGLGNLGNSTRSTRPATNAAASGNILESRRRICDGVEHAHGLLSEWWSAHATGLTSVCLHSCPTGLTAVCRSVRRFSFAFSSNTDAMSRCQSSETTLRHPRESQLAVVERGMWRC
jgi:hypothetical protein